LTEYAATLPNVVTSVNNLSLCTTAGADLTKAAVGLTEAAYDAAGQSIAVRSDSPIQGQADLRDGVVDSYAEKTGISCQNLSLALHRFDRSLHPAVPRF